MLWQNGMMIRLESLGKTSEAVAINNRGQIIGTIGTASSTPSSGR